MAQIWVYSPTGFVREFEGPSGVGVEHLATEHPNFIYFEADLVPPGTEVFDGEGTLFRVYEALETNSKLTESDCRDLVNEMLNRGILFRERVKDDAH